MRAILIVLCFAMASATAELVWHPNLEAGKEEARRAGRAIVVVTLWKETVCASCDAWRRDILATPEVQAALEGYTTVQWLYDGLGGSVIGWTKQHGNTNDDPSVLVWLLDPEGRELAAGTKEAHGVSSFIAWLDEHRATSFPLVDPAAFPTLSKQAANVAARKGLGKTLAELRTLAADATASDAERQEAAALVAAVVPYAEWRLGRAHELESQDPSAALALYEEIATELAGDELGAQAKTTKDRLRKDPAFKDALAAHALYEKARALEREFKPCKAARPLDPKGCPACREKNKAELGEIASILGAIVRKYGDAPAVADARTLAASLGLDLR